ncbi:class III lanthionine synthetase LanKC N-terminal domain-containing protein [Streptococcus suis]
MFKMVDAQQVNNQIYGFKIHISATAENYKQVFQVVYPLLVGSKVCFKYIEEDVDVLRNFSELESRAESGKYFTIYPNSHIHFLELLEQLYRNIPKDLQGIYILSDRPYKDSNIIFYRYGFFEDHPKYNVNGIPTLEGPNGEIWQDYQKAYFDLPSWIEDIQEPQVFQKSYLAEKYQVTDCLRMSNGGNTYRGFDKETNQEVIIKEARAEVVSYEKITKKMLRENEYKYAKYLQASNRTPKTFERVKEWINDYYIYENIRGQNLLDYASPMSLFTYSSDTPSENIDKFQHFLSLTKQLVHFIDYFHKRNIVLNDIHANNFIVSEDNKLYFIDLENSYENENDNLIGIYNEISLKEWNRLDGKLGDCHKLANLILFLLGRLQIRSGEKYEAHLIDDLLSRYGIKTNLSQLISYLLTDEASISVAKEMVENVRVELGQVCCELIPYENSMPEVSIPISQLLDLEGLSQYIRWKEDDERLKILIDRESNMGLDGLAGVLVLMEDGALSATHQQYVVTKILDNIVETEYGASIAYGQGYASPYLTTGVAGVLKALQYIGYPKFLDLSQELVKGLLVEYGQYPDFRQGMLGVTDTLLDIFSATTDQRLLTAIEKQLVMVAIKAKYDKKLQKELLYVFSRYGRMKNEFITKKQTV